MKSRKRMLKHSKGVRGKWLAVFAELLMILGITACADISGADKRELLAAVIDAGGGAEADQNVMSNDSLVFYDTDGGVIAARYRGEEQVVVIPDSCQGKSVVEIGENCFAMQGTLRSVTIPDSVETIGVCAFGLCSSLKSVHMPDHVTVIGKQAFASCTSLESIVIPDGVTAIGKEAFIYCENLRDVAIPEGMREIGEKAFQDCVSLECMVIPGSVERIGEWAFAGCTNLMNVELAEGVQEIGEDAFSGCTNLRAVEIPDSVVVLGRAFHGDDVVVIYGGKTYTRDNMDELYGQFQR